MLCVMHACDLLTYDSKLGINMTMIYVHL